MKQSNSKDLSKLVKKLTHENFKEYAGEVAHAYFPVGTLVRYQHTNIHFGIVKSISKTGKIIVQNGKLPEYKTTPVDGMSYHVWYIADLNSFQPLTKKEMEFDWRKATNIFNPRYLSIDRDSKYIKINSPIEYSKIQGNKAVQLSRVEIIKNWKKDLILYDMDIT